MSTVHRTTSATPDAVWGVIADGWTFASWVVGASRMRAVETAWPAQGSRLHHSVGTWPALIDDHTEVLECEPGRRIVMQARIRPVGEATVEIVLEPEGTGTRMTMSENFTKGPATLAPKPLQDAGLVARNRETLKRLAFLAEKRTDA